MSDIVRERVVHCALLRYVASAHAKGERGRVGEREEGGEGRQVADTF